MTFGVRREKGGDVIVVEGEAGCAQALGVGREVELAADDARFELRGAIAAIAEALQHALEVRQEEDVDAGGPGQRLNLMPRY